MRCLRYHVAMSLDGFIAGPKGDYDWITSDPSFDFAAFFRQFDTLLMGRHTYEIALARGDALKAMGMKVVVASTTLKAKDHPGVDIVGRNLADAVAALKAQTGKDIWLFGGGALFRSLLDAGLVDTVELSVIPVLLASGVPLLPEGRRCSLRLRDCKATASGTVLLSYGVDLAR